MAKKNWSPAVTSSLRTRIMEEADPIDFLCRVVRGEEFDGDTPPLPMRVEASLKLLAKIVPDLKAMELTTDGANLEANPAADALERISGKLGRKPDQAGKRVTTH